MRFSGTGIVTYDLPESAAGRRVDFTVVGENARAPGYILTGYAVDGGAPWRDYVSVMVRTPTGTLVYSGEGPVSEGDVVIDP